LLETLPTLAAGQHVLITVSDTGPGIDENVVERVFDPFFTTKPRGKGSGLGLSTAIGIVRNLGGDIQVANKTDGGAEFAVYLPASGPRGAVETQLAAGAPKGDGERILVIDDEELNVDVVTRILAGLGYSVVGTTTAGDALKAVKEEPDGFDLVLSDQLMPEMNGTDLARKIRKISPDLPVVLMSGHALGASKQVRRRAGVFDLISKPFDVAELGETLHRALHGT